MSTFSKRLITERKKLGLTQEQIAKQLGITRSAYTYYETNKTQPSLETAIKLADVMKVSLDYLVGRY
jgi:transcriptional regulator with XRE-family HTH domain